MAYYVGFRVYVLGFRFSVLVLCIRYCPHSISAGQYTHMPYIKPVIDCPWGGSIQVIQPLLGFQKRLIKWPKTKKSQDAHDFRQNGA